MSLVLLSVGVLLRRYLAVWSPNCRMWAVASQTFRWFRHRRVGGSAANGIIPDTATIALTNMADALSRRQELHVLAWLPTFLVSINALLCVKHSRTFLQTSNWTSVTNSRLVLRRDISILLTCHVYPLVRNVKASSQERHWMAFGDVRHEDA